MSEIGDRVRQRVKEILIKPLKVPYQQDAAEMMVQGALNQTEEILAIPALAIVDREAKLPSVAFYATMPLYKEALKKAGWVKEVV